MTEAARPSRLAWPAAERAVSRTAISALLGYLYPPDGDDADGLSRWRLVMFGTVAGSAVATALLYLLLLGIIGPGYAQVTAVAEVRQEIRAGRATTVEQSMRELREKQCRHLRDNQAVAARYSASQLDRLRSEYYRLSGREWPMPTCAELGY